MLEKTCHLGQLLTQCQELLRHAVHEAQSGTDCSRLACLVDLQ